MFGRCFGTARCRGRRLVKALFLLDSADSRKMTAMFNSSISLIAPLAGDSGADTVNAESEINALAVRLFSAITLRDAGNEVSTTLLGGVLTPKCQSPSLVSRDLLLLVTVSRGCGQYLYIRFLLTTRTRYRERPRSPCPTKAASGSSPPFQRITRRSDDIDSRFRGGRSRNRFSADTTTEQLGKKDK